jgi:hypothetical protein
MPLGFCTNKKFGTADRILCSTTRWGGYGVRSRIVDAVGYLCREPPTKYNSWNSSGKE